MKIEKTLNGNIYYYNDKNQIHRIDGPAIITRNGHRYWLINSKLHRLDGPACELKNNEKVWYYQGMLIGKSKENFNQITFEKWLKLKAFQ